MYACIQKWNVLHVEVVALGHYTSYTLDLLFYYNTHAGLINKDKHENWNLGTGVPVPVESF